MFAAIGAALAMTTPEVQRAALHEIGPYRSRGKGRGTPSRRYGNPTGRYMPHQGRQERLRRALGGWAFRKRLTGLTKRQIFADIDLALSTPLAVNRVREIEREEALV